MSKREKPTVQKKMRGADKGGGGKFYVKVNQGGGGNEKPGQCNLLREREKNQGKNWGYGGP